MNALLGFLADWKIKLAIIALVLIGAFTWHKVDVKVKVNKAVALAVAEIREQSAKENAKLADRSLTAKIELQDKANKIQKDKDNEIANLKSRVRTLSDSLQQRPTNRQEPSGVPYDSRDAQSKAGATGLQLSRPDATMALWFAGDAAELQSELKACYKQYDEAKSILDKFKRDNTPQSQ